ncbi:hypothetical protein CROQUDRAFT_43829 [Cronartium quercuum f. sp. fusiforme G11]|uniref:dolichyl-P-Glc:Man9GlcNAc2-PP-dolichol alpha-1,3-glucosyltransferase n=1 Tax=Cronartium quercuum f. sp. fusiforme G11 TaxID=708437 RepID=A0A9P6TCI6_9BASI|nr:hypothetical protein CROQUDRAFT_43829 [Cronartium quercuum f. sp. fusiforme G11]
MQSQIQNRRTDSRNSRQLELDSEQRVASSHSDRPVHSSSNKPLESSYYSQDGCIPPSSAPILNPQLDHKTNVKPSRERRTTSTKRRPGDGSYRSPSIYSVASSTLISHVGPEPSLGFLKASRQLEHESTSFQSRMEESCGAQSLIAQVLRYWTYVGKGRQYIIILSVSVVILLKASVSLGGYSGFSQGPLFGDLEAQRHWMGLTLHHWGLDYPPLTAYHSWLLAQIGRAFNPIFVALRPPQPNSDTTGWGDLHDSLKFFLRWTVLGSDLVIWIPTVFLYCFVAYDPLSRLDSPPEQSHVSRAMQKCDWKRVVHSALLLLLNPNLILIDNGHFQYNSIMLGLALGSVVSFHLNRDLLGAALYVCSMCFKQMALYYSPAIFAYLFGKCLFLRHMTGISLFIQIALVSIVTLLTAFLPLLLFAPFPETILQAIHRIFPLARGLFEDKVANFWCAANVLIKFRNLAPVTTLAKVALFITFMAVLPGVIALIWVSWTLGSTRSEDCRKAETIVARGQIPRSLNLLPYSLFNASIAFYLFSFQVHEKTILLPLLPLMMIMSRQYSAHQLDINHDWEWTCLISNVACFSMWPLLKKDGLCWQYGTLTLLYNYLIGYHPLKVTNWSAVDGLAIVTYASIALIHFGELMIPAPQRFPDLYVVLNLTLSFAIFSLSYLWSLVRLVQEGWGLVGLTSQLNIASPSSFKTEFRPPSRTATPSTHDPRADSIGPGLIFMDEEKFPRDASKNKRATSLQPRRKKAAHQVFSDSEPSRSRSLGGLGRSSLAPLKAVPRAKPMISSPGAEKLMNRIRNRVNSDHVNSRTKLGALARNRLLKEPVPPTFEDRRPAPLSQSLLGKEIECQDKDLKDESASLSESSLEEHESEYQSTGLREEEGEGSVSGGATTKLEVVEQDWETALRHSREGAIRRRREELRLVGKGKQVAGYVDALDLVNGPARR